MNITDAANTTLASLLVSVLRALVLVGVDQLTKFAATGGGCGPVICPLRNDVLMLGVGGGTTVDVVAAGVAGLAMFGAWVWVANRPGQPAGWPCLASQIGTRVSVPRRLGGGWRTSAA